MSQRIAQDWQTSPRLVTALSPSGGDGLAAALQVGELLGTLSLLESQTVVSSNERQGILADAGLPEELADSLWARLAPGRR
jgi:hypothetical protein